MAYQTHYNSCVPFLIFNPPMIPTLHAFSCETLTCLFHLGWQESSPSFFKSSTTPWRMSFTENPRNKFPGLSLRESWIFQERGFPSQQCLIFGGSSFPAFENFRRSPQRKKLPRTSSGRGKKFPISSLPLFSSFTGQSSTSSLF